MDEPSLWQQGVITFSTGAPNCHHGLVSRFSFGLLLRIKVFFPFLVPPFINLVEGKRYNAAVLHLKAEVQCCADDQSCRCLRECESVRGEEKEGEKKDKYKKINMFGVSKVQLPLKSNQALTNTSHCDAHLKELVSNPGLQCRVELPVPLQHCDSVRC